MGGLKYIEEGLIDTLHTMLTKDKISMSDYRMWFHLNNKTKISIFTPLGETDGATIMNSKGQGSSSAALASSLNMCSRRFIIENIKKLISFILFLFAKSFSVWSGCYSNVLRFWVFFAL